MSPTNYAGIKALWWARLLIPTSVPHDPSWTFDFMIERWRVKIPGRLQASGVDRWLFWLDFLHPFLSMKKGSACPAWGSQANTIRTQSMNLWANRSAIWWVGKTQVFYSYASGMPHKPLVNLANSIWQAWEAYREKYEEIYCVCAWKNSFRALAKKEKLLGAWDQGTAQGWPERLLNITSNYITGRNVIRSSYESER